MIWIAIKAAEGDTLTSIAKTYKNKDAQAILKYPGNKKIATQLKKGESLAKGTMVWVLNPNGKCYVVEKGGCKTVLTEPEYKKLQKDIHKQMDQVVERQRINYNSAADRHIAQRKINDDQWFVSSVVGIMAVDEPSSKKAFAAYKKLEAAGRKRDYKAFPALAAKCEEEVVAYTNGVIRWVNDLIDTAEGTVTVLEHVKTAGQFCGTLAAVTIAAPATLAAGVVVGAAASGGVGLLYDGAENTSLAANGMKTMSPAEIGKRFLVNAATGAAGALIAGGILKFAKGPIVNLLTKNGFVKQQAARVASRVIPKGVFEAELKNVAAAVTKNGTVHIDTFRKAIATDRVMIEAATKFFVRLGNGAFMKEIEASKKIEGVIFGWVKSAPKELSKDEKAAGNAAADAVIKSGVADDIFDKVIKNNMKDFQKVLNEVLTEHVKKVEKKQAA